MKSVLLSVLPQWCELIASGKKTLEIRKNRPKLETPFKCYLYCTQGKQRFWYSNALMVPYRYVDDHSHNLYDEPLNGKVIGEFVCDRIDTIECSSDAHNGFSKQSCLSPDDFIKYCNGQDLYGWHISALQIYDKPRELSEFSGFRKTKFGMEPVKITHPAQSWCYVEGKESMTDRTDEIRQRCDAATPGP